MGRLSKTLAVLLDVDVLRPKKSDRFLRHLQRYFAHYRCDLLIDCGANAGQFASECRVAGYQGEILSLEPLSAPFARLAAATERDPRWTALQVAVGSKDGTLALNFTEGSEEVASALEAEPTMIERFRGLAFEKRESVPLRRLDHLLDEREVPPTHRLFVKSDTQGFDLEVLAGLGTRLASTDGLALEMSVRSLYKGAPSHWQMLEFAHANGFEPYGFTTQARDSEGGMIEYDALFRRLTPGMRSGEKVG